MALANLLTLPILRLPVLHLARPKFHYADYELIDLDRIEFQPDIRNAQSFRNPQRLRMTFNLFNQSVELDLELNGELFSTDFTVQKSHSTGKRSENLELSNLNCFYHGRLRAAAYEERSKASTKRSGGHRFSEQIAQPATGSNELFAASIVSLSICNGLRGFIQANDYLYLINPLSEQLIRRFNLHNRAQLQRDTLLVKRTKNTDLIRNLEKQITSQVLGGQASKANDQLRRANASEELIKTNRSGGQVSGGGGQAKEHGTDDEQAATLERTKRSTARLDYRNNPRIELAVFADEALYNYLKNTHFIRTDHQIVTFILTILNGIQTLYNQFHKYDIDLKFNIVLLEIFQKQPKVS